MPIKNRTVGNPFRAVFMWDFIILLAGAFLFAQLIVLTSLIAKTSEHQHRMLAYIGNATQPSHLPFAAVISSNKSCHTNEELFLFVYIHSSPANFQQRRLIRRTWGNVSLYTEYTIQILFFIGLDMNISSQAIEQESKDYNDIIQCGFIDSYRNLTYKAMTAMHYVLTHCRHAKFIMKSDDDALVNMYQLLPYLSSKYSHHKELLLGQALYSRPIRNNSGSLSRWYVSRTDWSKDKYPQFVSGIAFMMSPDTVEKLYQHLLTTPMFWIDDVFITGIVRTRANITITKFNDAYILDFSKVYAEMNSSWIFTHAARQPEKNVLRVWEWIVRAHH